MVTNQEKCDFCESSDFLDSYSVPDSLLGMIVQVCSRCGLVQSLQTKPKPIERLVSTSSGATWGNIRHGKGLRLNAAIQILKRVKEWEHVNVILDVGSNRGDFIKWLLSEKKNASVMAVEPDIKIVDSYKDLENVKFIGDRFENVNIQESVFDFVYLSHTLEHADSASQMLKKIYTLLKSGGLLFLEVPNLAVIEDDDIFEEFFIDKHRFHFSKDVLKWYLRRIGYTVVFESLGDRYNISLLLRKSDLQTDVNQITEDPKVVSERLAVYRQRLLRNRLKLKSVSMKLAQLMSRQKVALWGAGRQFDALVRFGELDTSLVKFLVDEHLWKYLPQIHGVPVHRPEELKRYDPQVVVIFARGSADEIAERVRRFSIKNVIKLRDLMI